MSCWGYNPASSLDRQLFIPKPHQALTTAKASTKKTETGIIYFLESCSMSVIGLIRCQVFYLTKEWPIQTLFTPRIPPSNYASIYF
jgi:hypothetical protein